VLEVPPSLTLRVTISPSLDKLESSVVGYFFNRGPSSNCQLTFDPVSLAITARSLCTVFRIVRSVDLLIEVPEIGCPAAGDERDAFVLSACARDQVCYA
jgi:hypothetical protein